MRIASRFFFYVIGQIKAIPLHTPPARSSELTVQQNGVQNFRLQD